MASLPPAGVVLLGSSSASVEENVRPTGRSPKPGATPTVRLHERLVLYVVAVDL